MKSIFSLMPLPPTVHGMSGLRDKLIVTRQEPVRYLSPSVRFAAVAPNSSEHNPVTAQPSPSFFSHPGRNATLLLIFLVLALIIRWWLHRLYIGDPMPKLDPISRRRANRKRKALGVQGEARFVECGEVVRERIHSLGQQLSKFTFDGALNPLAYERVLTMCARVRMISHRMASDPDTVQDPEVIFEFLNFEEWGWCGMLSRMFFALWPPSDVFAAARQVVEARNKADVEVGDVRTGVTEENKKTR